MDMFVSGLPRFICFIFLVCTRIRPSRTNFMFVLSKLEKGVEGEIASFENECSIDIN